MSDEALDDAFGRLAELFENGTIQAAMTPVHFIDRVTAEVVALRAEVAEWKRRRNVSAEYALKLQGVLASIADHPHNAYPESGGDDRSYDIGVTDGHRCAAQIAALNLGRNCPGCGHRHQPGVSCTEHAKTRAALGAE